jgi:hypothetical protein
MIWNKPEEIAAFQAMLDKAPTASAQVASSTPASVSPAVAPTPAQNVAQPASQDESSADAARRAKQHAACLELAKDNPSITCK